MNYTIDSYLFDWVDKIRCKEETTCPTWSSFLVQERGLQSPDIKQNEKREIGQKTAAPTKKSSFSSLFLYIRVVYIYTMAVLAGTKLYFIHTHTHIYLLATASFWLPPPSTLSLSFLDTTTTKKNRKESFLLPKERERENRGHARSQWSDLWPNQKVPSLQCYSNTQRDIKFFRVQKKFVGRKERREKKKQRKKRKKRIFHFTIMGNVIDLPVSSSRAIVVLTDRISINDFGI